MNKNILKKGVATLLAATMIGSFSGCKSNEKHVNDIQNDYIVSDINEDNQILVILVKYNKQTYEVVEEERYGYIDNENQIFHDIISGEKINLNDEMYDYFFDTYYLNFANFYFHDKNVSNKKKKDYKLNGGISIGELMRFEEELKATKAKLHKTIIVDNKKTLKAHPKDALYFNKYDSNRYSYESNRYYTDRDSIMQTNSYVKR